MKQDKRSIKRFRCLVGSQKQYVYDIQNLSGKLIKAFAEIEIILACRAGNWRY